MNRDELAQSLNMSKATLYKRCRALNIPIDSLDSLTDEQKTKLMNFKRTSSNKKNNNLHTLEKSTIDESQIPHNDTDSLTETLLQQNKSLINQLNAKDSQLEVAQENIKHANQLATEAHKLGDQAQQLQLDLQHQLQITEQERLDLLNKNKQLMMETSTSSELEEEINTLSNELEDAQS
ncbi:hypothetical protein, partial [Periweissella ghanensis]|uniref:hypothetical protein n=1 Tax=Periweissella ghanensis TaxID=467997 RepID=UPI00202E03BE